MSQNFFLYLKLRWLMNARRWKLAYEISDQLAVNVLETGLFLNPAPDSHSTPQGPA